MHGWSGCAALGVPRDWKGATCRRLRRVGSEYEHAAQVRPFCRRIVVPDLAISDHLATTAA